MTKRIILFLEIFKCNLHVSTNYVSLLFCECISFQVTAKQDVYVDVGFFFEKYRGLVLIAYFKDYLSALEILSFLFRHILN